MKVIFIEDVPMWPGPGRPKKWPMAMPGTILFPRKLAVLADSQAAAAVEAHLKKVAKQRALEEAEMAELAKKISRPGDYAEGQGRREGQALWVDYRRGYRRGAEQSRRL